MGYGESIGGGGDGPGYSSGSSRSHRGSSGPSSLWVVLVVIGLALVAQALFNWTYTVQSVAGQILQWWRSLTPTDSMIYVGAILIVIGFIVYLRRGNRR